LGFNCWTIVGHSEGIKTLWIDIARHLLAKTVYITIRRTIVVRCSEIKPVYGVDGVGDSGLRLEDDRTYACWVSRGRGVEFDFGY
jgi:hypothetical protein